MTTFDSIPVYSFRDYSKNKLSSQVDELSASWQDERFVRVELQRLLKQEQRVSNDLHYELKELKTALVASTHSYQSLKQEWDATKAIYDKTLSSEKQLKRDKKELQQKITSLNEQIELLQKDINRHKEDERRWIQEMAQLKQERLVEDEKEGAWRARELVRANERVVDLEKRMEEMKRGFEIERGRYQNRQVEMGNDSKRSMLEREKLTTEVAAAEKRLEEKNKQLFKALEEIDKLEEEAKKCDEELESLHTKVLQLEQEKRLMKREMEETKQEASERVTRETADYVNRLNELRVKYQKATAKIEQMQKEQDEVYAKMQEEFELTLQNFKIDTDMLREENRALSLQIKELRREEMSVNPRVETETLQMRQELGSLRTFSEKLKSQLETERKQFTVELEEEQKKVTRFTREIDTLRKDINTIKQDNRECNNEWERKSTKLEEKNKRLVTDLNNYKKENERLIGDQQQLKNIAESDLRRKVDTIVGLEGTIAELEKKNEKTEEKLRSATYDLKQAKAEIDRLTEAFESLKKEKIRLADFEKEETTLMAEAKRKENELKENIQVLTKSLESWKEKAKSAEASVEQLVSDLAEANEAIHNEKNKQQSMQLELNKTVEQVKELNAKVAQKDQTILQNQQQFVLDIKVLNQQIAELNSQISRLKTARDRQQKEEIEQIKSNEDAKRRQIEIENSRVQQQLKNQIEDTMVTVSQLKKQIQENEVLIHRREEEISSLRNQLISIPTTDNEELEAIKQLYEQTKRDVKAEKEKYTPIIAERDQLQEETNKLKKQIKFLEGTIEQETSKNEEHFKTQLQLKENERLLRAEIASRDNKINSLTSQQDAIRAQSTALQNENLTLEQEKAKLLKDVETLRMEDIKAALTLTIERLRKEAEEKDELVKKMVEDHTKSKRDFEKANNDLKEQLKSKSEDHEALQKSKTVLEKDHADLTAILKEKMADTKDANEIAQLKNQVLRLSEQLTYMNIEESDLNEQLSKVEAEKLNLIKELAHLKEHQITIKKVKQKNKREKEKLSLRKQVHKLAEKSAEAILSPRSQMRADKMVFATVLVQSRIRGMKARKQYKEHKYRHKVAREIFTTERSYVSSLRVLLDSYIEPLRKLTYFTEEEIQIVFGNVEQIYKNNSVMCDSLEERVENWHATQCLGDVFLQNIEGLKPHVKFIEHFATNQELKERIVSGRTKMDEATKNAVELFFKFVPTMPQLEGKSFHDILIMPIQRVPRYRLLLDDLYKHTPKTHPDYATLTATTNQIISLATYINENNRRVETMMAMSTCTILGLEKLPPNKDRGLLMKGHVAAILSGSKPTDCMAHVFTDCVVFTKDTKKSRISVKLNEKIGLSQQEKLYHHVLFNSETFVQQHVKLNVAGFEYNNVIQLSDAYLIFSAKPRMIDFYNNINTALQIFQKQLQASGGN